MIRRRSPLKRGAPPRRTAALRQRSQKRREDERERRDVRLRVIARDGGCVMRGLPPCRGPLDVDEIVSRGRGGDWLDDDNCQTLCRRHHDLKHSRIHAASILGLWGIAKQALHEFNALGDAPTLDAYYDLHEWARAEYNRTEST